MTLLIASDGRRFPYAELPLETCGGAPIEAPDPCRRPVTEILAFPGSGAHGIYLAPRCDRHAADARANLADWPAVSIPACPAGR